MSKKIVQTEIPLSMYEEFREIAKKEKKKIKEAVREAISEYIVNRTKFNPEDPFFTLKPAAYKNSRASENIDKILYG